MAIRRVACYSYSLDAHEPMAYLRLIAPLRQLGIEIINGLQNHHAVGEFVYQSDVVIIQREFPRQFDEYKKVMAMARQAGKPVVLELDDLLFFLPEEHPDRKGHYYAPALLPMLQALIEVDAVIVTTSKIQEVLREYNENILVIPNYFDDTLWSFTPPALKSSSDEQTITIGYMGTYSHQPDLEYILPVLLSLLQRYPNRLRFRFWGAEPPARLYSLPQTEWVQCNYHSYEEFVTFFQPQTADIFIAPLVDTLFNHCKSSLKFFEYSALGVPGVFSRLAPYQDIIQHGQNGLLAYSLDEWEQSLIQLIEDAELRFHIATRAQETIRKDWLLSQNAFRWREALQSVPSSSGPPPPNTSLLDVINAQLFEAFRAFMDQISDQNNEMEKLKDQTAQLESEILRYVLSPSWRMTRPLRALSRRLNNKKC